MSEMINRICTRYTQLYPSVRQQYTIIPEAYWPEVLDSVRQGQTDVLEHVKVPAIYDKNLSYASLIRCRCGCMMDFAHSLAGKTSIELDDLDNLEIGIHDRSCVEGLTEALQRRAPRAHIIEADGGAKSAFEICSRGGVFLVATPYVSAYKPLLGIPLSDDLFWDFGLVYPPNPSKRIRDLIDVAQSLYSVECRPTQLDRIQDG